MENTSGIYKIQSVKKPDRCYIGSAISIKNRWWIHKTQLRKGIHHSPKLQRHYDKYGENDLIFSVLCNCEKEELINKEQFYIDCNNSYFNCYLTAGSPLGSKRTEEQNKKNSERRTGYKATDEAKRNMSISLKGKYMGRKPSEETKRKLSEIRKTQDPWPKGSKHTEETIKKMSKSHKGSEAWNKGLKMSEDARINISKGHIGQIPWNKGKTGVYSDETRKRISEKLTGTKLTDEHKKKISKSLKGNNRRAGITPWNKGKTGIFSEDTIKRISETLKGNRNYMGSKKMKESILKETPNTLNICQL